ncbi:hypothetical protein P9597_24770 [Aneurinibacillus migulanus]|nr:hypothetical protein [Aneurinibacillus migulanus]
MDKEKQGTPTTLKELEKKHEMQKEVSSTMEHNQKLKEVNRKEEMIQDEP